MSAAWRVTRRAERGDRRRSSTTEKLDYELFDRWLKFLAKPPQVLSVPEAVAGDGQERRHARPKRKKLADEFQALILEVMFERKEVNDENDVIKAKALPGTKKKEPAKLPSDFVTNDDFCPGCGLELKSMPIERQNLWTDVFQRDLAGRLRSRPGVRARQAGPARVPRLGTRAAAERRAPRATSTRCATTSRSCGRSSRRSIRSCTAWPTPRSRSNLKVSLRGSPYNLGDEAPRHFLSILSDGEPAPFTKGSGRLELADAILKQPIADARDRQPRSGRGTSARAWSIRRATSA